VPVHCQQGYAERAILPRGGLPVTERLCRKILSLPMYPELSDTDVDRVIASIRSAKLEGVEAPPKCHP
jgi:dTDP-4-amino-4,6-dideoxygalactose transaminase